MLYVFFEQHKKTQTTGYFFQTTKWLSVVGQKHLWPSVTKDHGCIIGNEYQTQGTDISFIMVVYWENAFYIRGTDTDMQGTY